MFTHNYLKALPTISIFFIGGILNSLLMKLMLIEKAKNSEGKVVDFAKPYFITTLQYIGMAISIFYYMIRSCRNREKYPNICNVMSLKLFFSCAIPAFADVFQGIISTITIEFVGVSIHCMMKSGTLIGVTFISQFIFKKYVYNYQWFSIGLIAIALVIIGLSSTINSNESDSIKVNEIWDVIIIILKLVSQFVYSVKICYEEYLTQKLNYDEVLITGVEGIWTMSFSFLLVLISNFIPGKDGNGLHEDLKDTLTMVLDSTLLKILIPCLILLNFIYNVNSVILISRTSSITRTLADSLRNFATWLIQLILYYWFTTTTTLLKYKGIGEQWLSGSYLQLLGYIIMLFGVIQHHGFPKLPFFNYDNAQDSELADIQNNLIE